MAYSKKQLQEHIAEYELGIELRAIVLETIEQFKHYKRVDQRFLDALKAKGCRAYKQSSSWAFCKVQLERDGITVEMHISEHGNDWNKMRQSVIFEYPYEKWIEQTKNSLERFDEELSKLKEIRKQVKEIKCLGASSVELQLDRLIRELEQGGN